MTGDDEQKIGHLFHVAGIIAQAEGIADAGTERLLIRENADKAYSHPCALARRAGTCMASGLIMGYWLQAS